MLNSGATLPWCMRKLLGGLDHLSHYIDDTLVHTCTWEEHVIALKELFRRPREANLTVSPSKCVIGTDKIELLGHEVGQGIITPPMNGMEKVKTALRPRTKGIMLFLVLQGSTGSIY